MLFRIGLRRSRRQQPITTTHFSVAAKVATLLGFPWPQRQNVQPVVFIVFSGSVMVRLSVSGSVLTV